MKSLKSDYEILKDKYGERFAKMCRSFFPSILAKDGVLSKIIISKFEPSKLLYDDIQTNGLEESFKSIISNEYLLMEDEKEYVESTETPMQLFKKAGYTLYECTTNKEVLNFKKYYKDGEVLCTFREIDYRLKNYHIFWAVKDNVNKITRNKFWHPKRDDEYGTSVISLQFDKQTNLLSIKNRYNHTVLKPDSTFDNNLENIYPGLTYSFKKHYHIDKKHPSKEIRLNGYILGDDKKFYKCNFTHEGVSYCAGNVIVKKYGEVEKYSTQRYELIDNFLLDKKTKTLKQLNADDYSDSSEIGENFLNINHSLTKMNTPNVETIGNNFLQFNNVLKEFNMPNLISIGSHCLTGNEELTTLEAPKLKTAGDHCFSSIKSLLDIKLPELKKVGSMFLYEARNINNFEAPKLEVVGDWFLADAKKLTKIYFPKLKYIGDKFLRNNNIIKDINLPEVVSIGSDFCYNNVVLETFSAPKLEVVQDAFLLRNENCKFVKAPHIKQVGKWFMGYNTKLRAINFPFLKYIDFHFLSENNNIEEVNLPEVTKIGNGFMGKNKKLRRIHLPKVEIIHADFLLNNTELEKLELPNALCLGGRS